VLRSRGYHALLLAAALIGLPIALIAFGFPVVLMLEVVGFAGRQVLLVLLLCLVSSGIGALIFTGMGHWTGISVPSLQIPGLPAATVDWGDLLWVIPIAILAAVGAQTYRRLGLRVAQATAAHTLAATTAAGLLVGACAAAYTLITGRSALDVLQSGEAALPALVGSPTSWSVVALLLLLIFKGAAYGLSLGSFRGGPTFPAVFLGAVIGVRRAVARTGDHGRDRHRDDRLNHCGPATAGDLDRARRATSRAGGHKPAPDHPAGRRGCHGRRCRARRARPPRNAQTWRARAERIASHTSSGRGSIGGTTGPWSLVPVAITVLA